MKKIALLILLVELVVIQMMAQYASYLPIAREGVTWVNEKVIINHGDTTSYYYKYEFRGMDTIETSMSHLPHKGCYYYTEDELDITRDSLIAGLRDESRKVFSYRNVAYDTIEGNYRHRLYFWLSMIPDGGSRLLYPFFSPSYPLYYYLEQQDFWLEIYARDFGYEPFIKEENIRELDPIMIEGYECLRCAYLDDEGDTLCYVVEGIGFDSYDMGDLLTPFTPLKPDPDADYQEYCGLSHVIKDGHIIYKGMRYREGAYNAINEVVDDQPQRVMDDNYYNLMGQAVGKEVPSTPGIYIHQGRKIVVR